MSVHIYYTWPIVAVYFYLCILVRSVGNFSLNDLVFKILTIFLVV